MTIPYLQGMPRCLFFITPATRSLSITYFQNTSFLIKVSSLKAMQVELFLDESCLNSCELLMIGTKTSFASLLFQRNCLQHESWSQPHEGQT